MDGQENVGGVANAEEKISAELTAAVEAIKTQQNLAKVMMVPGVREALLAAEQGRRIQIVDESAAAPKPEQVQELTAEQLDELPNSALANHLKGQLLGALKAELQQIINPLTERLKTSEAHIESDLAAKVNADLNVLAQDYDDIDKFKEPMFKVYQETGIKDVNELYVLAKTRAKSAIVSKKALAAAAESELPFAAPGGRTPRTEIKAAAKGRAGWDSIMAQSLKAVGLSS